MEWWQILLVFFSALIFLMALRVPIAIALFTINIIGAIYFFGPMPGMRNVVLSIYNGLTSFVLVPVPLFILMGELLFRSNLAMRALHALDVWLGKMPGRLGVLATLGGTVFAVLSGSTMATTAMLGTMLLPEMEAKKYDRRLAMGSILGSGGLAMIIPPSALTVLFGAVSGIPIGPLLIAGILPGLIMAVLYTVNIVGRVKLNPALAAPYAVATVPWGEKFRLLVRDILPLGFVVFAVLGLIFLGVATPTESAALGAMAALILAIVYRQFNWPMLRESLLSTLRVTGMIFFILIASQVYSRIMSFSGATTEVVQYLTSLSVSPLMVLIIMQLTVIFLGCFLEQVSIMMITLPFYMPVVAAMGWDPLWFGILMLVNLQIAQTTPPFGLGLFIMKGVAPKDTRMTDIYMAAVPFLLCDLIAMALLIAFPILVTLLPALM